MSSKPAPDIQSVHAVLLCSGEYVLQLRDNDPTIAAPGQWALFGGTRGKGETPMYAIRREVSEELAIEPSHFRYLWFSDYFSYFEADVIRTWFFVSDVSDVWSTHILREGRDVGLFEFGPIAHLIMPQAMKETIQRYHRLGTR